MSFLKEAVDPSFVSEAIGGVVAIITAVTGFALRYHRAAVKRKKRDLDLACDDILFMLALEAKYIALLKEQGVKLHNAKVTMRASVREDGLSFSGKFTPGKVARSRAARGWRPAWYRIRANLEAMPEGSES